MSGEETSSIRRAPEVEDLFPHGRVFACTVTASPIHRATLVGAERVGIESMGEQRLDEYSSARAAARVAMAELKVAEPVKRGPSREPVWPAGITGSIAHSRGLCIAAVAERGTAGAELVIGVDLEHESRVSGAIARRVLTPDETTAMNALPGEQHQSFVASVFALKEAFYKAHHQLEARFLGFDVVAVVLDDDRLGARFASTGQPLAVDPQVCAGARLNFDGERITAAVWIEPGRLSDDGPERALSVDDRK